MTSSIVMAILWVAFALLVGALMSKLMKLIHFPNVTGFLLAGIIIGPFVIGWISQDAFKDCIKNLSWISEIALGFIAFSIGGSFKISALKKVGTKATVITVLEALGAAFVVVGGLFIGYFLGLKNIGLTIPMILILGSIACATAPAATLLIINQYKAKGSLVDTLIPVVAFDDAVALIVFSVLFSIASIIAKGGAFNAIDGLLIPVLEIFFSLLIGALFGFILSMLTRWFKSRHNRLILIIFTVLLCVGLSQIDTEEIFHWSFSFQLSSLLVVMAVGGIYVNMAKGISVTNEYLDKFTSPIFMLFFIISGSNLDFSIFAGDNALVVILIALVYVLTRIIGKYTGATIGASITRCDKSVKKYLGFTLIPQAGVALGLAAKASRLLANESGDMIYTIIIISTILYELFGPLVAKWALTKAGNITVEKKNTTV